MFTQLPPAVTGKNLLPSQSVSQAVGHVEGVEVPHVVFVRDEADDRADRDGIRFGGRLVVGDEFGEADVRRVVAAPVIGVAGAGPGNRLRRIVRREVGVEPLSHGAVGIRHLPLERQRRDRVGNVGVHGRPEKRRRLDVELHDEVALIIGGQAKKLLGPQAHVLRRDVVVLEELPQLRGRGRPELGAVLRCAVVSPRIAGPIGEAGHQDGAAAGDRRQVIVDLSERQRLLGLVDGLDVTRVVAFGIDGR